MLKNKIAHVIEPRSSDIGIPIKRILPFAKKRMVGPFIFLDHMGPVTLTKENRPMNVRSHPHIGLSTLTYLFEGEIFHKDSLGFKQAICPGEVNWMTSGKGIVHAEQEREEVKSTTRTIHGLQFWVALPKELEDIDPSFVHYHHSDIPVIKNESYEVKVVAGSLNDKTSKLQTYSPMTLLVIKSYQPGTFSFGKVGHEYGIYIVDGTIKVDDQIYSQNQFIVFEKDSSFEIEFSENSLFSVIGGVPLTEERFIWWNFVSTSKEKIENAKIAWNEGSFPQVPGEIDKIPLPQS